MITVLPVWAVATITFVLSIGGIELMRRWGLEQLLDLPNARSSHTRPTPRGGGLPVILAVLGVWSGFVTSLGAWGSPWGHLLAGTLVVAAISWVDDLRGLPFRVLLMVHTVAAVLVLVAAPPPSSVLLPGAVDVPLGPGAWVLAVIWVAGLANAYNFMDGIDGIAGGQGLVAAIAWACWGFEAGVPAVGGLGVALAAGCAAFLLFNWSPARIFMGDVGAATLGFLFAVLPFVLARHAVVPVPSAWIAGAAAVWPFVFDSGFTLVRRWRGGERVFEAHRSHLYQRLVIAGWGHARTTALYIGWAVATAGVGHAMMRGAAWSGVVGLLFAALSGVFVWRLTLRVEGAR